MFIHVLECGNGRTMGGDLAPSLGGTEKYFADLNFGMTFL